MNRKGEGGIYIFLGIVIIVVIILIFVLWKFDVIKDFFRKGAPKETPPEIIYKSVFLYAKDKKGDYQYLSDISYEVLDNTSKILQQGTLKAGYNEQFQAIDANQTFFLKASNSAYYSNIQACNFFDSKCIVWLDKTAKPVLSINKIKDYVYLANLYLEDGLLVEPIVCASWNNLLKVDLNMTEVNVPTTYFLTYDKCFSFENPKNLTSGIYNFFITPALITGYNNDFRIDVLDKCEGDYREGCAPTVSQSVSI